MSDELDTILNAAAANPKKVEVDGQVVEQHPIRDLILLDKHLANKSNLNKGLGIKLFKIMPGGTTS